MFRLACAVLPALAAGALPAAASPSAQAAPFACPPGRYCDFRLGVALPVSPGWVRLPHVPPGEVDFARLGAGEGYLRFVVRAYAFSSYANPAHAALAAARQLSSDTHREGTSWRAVRYAGYPGVISRSLPATPQPAAYLLLAHGRLIYLFIIPGTSFAPDEQRALSGLSWVPRTGAFPLMPSLVITPEPISPGGMLHVALTGVRPATVYRLTARPAGTAGPTRLIRQLKTGALGAIHFTYPNSALGAGSGLWRMTAAGRGGTAVAQGTFVRQ